jgi:hypothetical protein
MSFKAVDLTTRINVSERVVHRSGVTYHEHTVLLTLKQPILSRESWSKISPSLVRFRTDLRQCGTGLSYKGLTSLQIIGPRQCRGALRLLCVFVDFTKLLYSNRVVTFQKILSI